MPSFDPVKARAHRFQQAELGLPLLRGCASTAANALVAHFDSLGRAGQMEFARQFSDFAQAQATQQPMSVDGHGAFSLHQFSYSFSLPGTKRLPFLAYENLWLTSTQWDYLTESNAERSIGHFAEVIEAAISLV